MEANCEFIVKMSKYIIHHCDFMMLTYHELQSSAEVVTAIKKIFSIITTKAMK